MPTRCATSAGVSFRRNLIALSFGCRQCQRVLPLLCSWLGWRPQAQGVRRARGPAQTVVRLVASCCPCYTARVGGTVFFVWLDQYLLLGTMVLLVAFITLGTSRLSLLQCTVVEQSPPHPVTEQHVALLGCFHGHGREPYFSKWVWVNACAKTFDV